MVKKQQKKKKKDSHSRETKLDTNISTIVIAKSRSSSHRKVIISTTRVPHIDFIEIIEIPYIDHHRGAELRRGEWAGGNYPLTYPKKSLVLFSSCLPNMVKNHNKRLTLKKNKA